MPKFAQSVPLLGAHQPLWLSISVRRSHRFLLPRRWSALGWWFGGWRGLCLSSGWRSKDVRLKNFRKRKKLLSGGVVAGALIFRSSEVKVGSGIASSWSGVDLHFQDALIRSSPTHLCKLSSRIGAVGDAEEALVLVGIVVLSVMEPPTSASWSLSVPAEELAAMVLAGGGG